MSQYPRIAALCTQILAEGKDGRRFEEALADEWKELKYIEYYLVLTEELSLPRWPLPPSHSCSLICCFNRRFEVFAQLKFQRLKLKIDHPTQRAVAVEPRTRISPSMKHRLSILMAASNPQRKRCSSLNHRAC